MTISFELLKQARNEMEENQRLLRLSEERLEIETQAYAINEFIDWLKPLGIQPDELIVSTYSKEVVAYTEDFTFVVDEYHQNGFGYCLTIISHESGSSEKVGIWQSNPLTWHPDHLRTRRVEILTALERLLLLESEPADELTDERVPLLPCWYGDLSQIEIETVPDMNEPGRSAAAWRAYFAENPDDEPDDDEDFGLSDDDDEYPDDNDDDDGSYDIDEEYEALCPLENKNMFAPGEDFHTEGFPYARLNDEEK